MTATELLKTKFKKVCNNAVRAYDTDKSGPFAKKVPMRFRRGDLTQWAKEAFDKGENYFYMEPVDKNYPNGRLRLCEPKYEYRLVQPLTEEEYQTLVSALSK